MTDVKDLETELAELESAIAEPDLAATDQVKLRERRAFVSARLGDLERQAPYTELDTEALQTQRDAGELSVRTSGSNWSPRFPTVVRTPRWLAS